MAFLTSRPNFAETMPDASPSGVRLLQSITANRIWRDDDLQYYLGNDRTLNLDSEFKQEFRLMLGQGAPDRKFAFAAETANAFKMIDSVVSLDFSRTNNAGKADQVIVSASKPQGDLEGFFEFPGTSFHNAHPGADSWSLGVFNSGFGYMRQGAELGGGEYANWTVIHEIGHSLGLKHTHNDNTGAPLPTVGKAMDNEMYSVMSYDPASDGIKYGHAVSMMALDVAALQALYGAEDYAGGNSSYTLMNARGGKLSLGEGSVSIGRAYYCIWDSGGSDMIDYGGGKQSVLINLNDATLNTNSIGSELSSLFSQLRISSFYKDLSHALQQEIVDKWHNAGGFFSHVLVRGGGEFKAIDGGFSIAHGAEIEDARGGGGNDLIIGNEGDNSLAGLGGADSIFGGSGHDLMYGGAGDDRLDGGLGDDAMQGGAGADRFIFADHYGFDVIADFTHEDIIDLTRLTGFSSYKDLFDNKMTEVKGSTYIVVGDDTLALYHVSKAELTNADFLI